MSNEGIELKIFAYDDPTRYIDTIEMAQTKQYLEGLSEPGSGKFNVNVNEPKTNADPSLLYYRNICKYSIDGKTIGAFILENNKKVLVNDGEQEAEQKEISGNGLLTWLTEAVVAPMFRQTRYTGDKRYFNFGSARDDWYDDSKWVLTTSRGRWGANPWGKRPTNWPKDYRANWISNAPLNTSFKGNEENIFRLEWVNSLDGGDWQIWAAGDDFLEMWLDGEKIIDTDFKKSSLDEATKVQITDLAQGNHVLAARVTNAGGSGRGNVLDMMFALYHTTGDTNTKNLKLYSGQNSTVRWRGMYLGTKLETPVWTPGSIILQLIGEAKARGIRSMGWIKPTFTSTRDSNGVPWITTPDDWEFDIGQDTVYSVMQKIGEKLGYYFWIDPDTYKLNMAQYRGKDRSVDPNAVVFELGKNLTSAELEGVGNKRKNSMFAKASTGWIVDDPSQKDVASIAKYGVLEGFYSADMRGPDMVRVLPAIMKQTAMAEEGATYQLITNEYQPWDDFGNGDMVIAPDKDGLNKPRQIVSLSFQENDETGRPDYTVEFDVVFQSQQRKIELAINKLTGGSSGSGFASSGGLGSSSGNPQLPPTSRPAPTQPLIPQNLVATSTGAWTPDGVTPVSTVTLTWDPVTLDTDDNEIVVEYYEIWGTKTVEPGGLRRLTSTTTNTVDITPLAVGESWNFQVRAFVDVSSPPSDFSSTITIVGVGPNSPLPAPSAPILSTSMGLVKVGWDGLLIDGNEPAPQFRYVYARVSLQQNGPYMVAGGAISRGGGETTLQGLDIGKTYWVQLFSVDGLGLVSDPSNAAPIEVEGVDLGPLKQDIDNAVAAVGRAVNDVRLNVNMLNDPSFEATPLVVWELGAGVAQAQTAPRSGKSHIRVTSNALYHDAIRYLELIPVDPGSSFYWKVYIRRALGSATAGEFQMGAYTKATADEPWINYVKMADSLAFDSSDYQIFEGYLTVPDGDRFISPVIRVMDATSGHVSYIDDARMFIMTDDTTIVPGSINADALAAGSVIAGKLAAGSVDTQALQAESIIGIHIGAQEITGDKMAFNTLTGNHLQVGSIGVDQLSPSIGQELDISANGAVNIIVGRLSDIEDSDFAQNSDLEQMQTYYAFTPEGAVVSTPSSPFAVRIDNDSIDMLENGATVSYWNSGTLYVDKLVGTQVVLGNHQLEQYNDGTVVRAVSNG